MKYTEAKLEQAIVQLLSEQGHPYTPGTDITRGPQVVLLTNDLLAHITVDCVFEKGGAGV
jgi:type I restriction enzyme R subunit